MIRERGWSADRASVVVTMSPLIQGGGDEIPLAEDALEPTIATNRGQPPDDNIIVVAYMKNSTIERVRSTDQGASFEPALRSGLVHDCAQRQHPRHLVGQS